MSDCPNIYDTCMHAGAEQFICRKSVPTQPTISAAALFLVHIMNPFGSSTKAMQINNISSQCVTRPPTEISFLKIVG